MTDEQLAGELAGILMRHCAGLGPLGRIGALTRLARILRLVVRYVTERRARDAYALTALWSHSRIADLMGANKATMQKWIEAGQKLAATQKDPHADRDVRTDGYREPVA